jgi:lipopolysaccharide transport system ATP-binding protein
MRHSIQVTNLSKKYRLGQRNAENMLRGVLSNALQFSRFKKKGKDKIIWALKDVSFEVEKGEVVGIIGRNGAGKSTLLKVLSKITYPTDGNIDVNGRVASLLEVGTGFHEELTGRENIYLNGSILGMKKKEIDQRMDMIVAFSGVENFLDTPIKRYSSGMRLRLGFAVAAHLDPDVLLVDEVLAVGDAGFQKKCLTAMKDLRSGGRTVLFVSHNMAAIENFCERVIWIDNGRIKEDGSGSSVIRKYMSTFGAYNGSTVSLRDLSDRRGNGDARFTGLSFLDESGMQKNSIKSGDSLVIRLYYECRNPVRSPHFGLSVQSDLGTLVTLTSTWHLGKEIPVLNGEGHIDLAIEFLNLNPSRYYLSLLLRSAGGNERDLDYDILENCIALDIEPSNYYASGRGIDSKFGLIFLPCRWQSDLLVDAND